MINYKKDFCIIITSCNNEKVKDKIVKELLKNRLAACIQSNNVHSNYIFNNVINSDNEIIIKIKTKFSLFNKVEKIIKELHDYEVPQIIAVPIVKISDDYSDWLEEVIMPF